MKKPKLASLSTLSVLLLFQKAVHKIFLETFYFKKKKEKKPTQQKQKTQTQHLLVPCSATAKA